MRPKHPVCDVHDVQSTGGNKMKTMNMEKTVAREDRTGRGERRVQVTTPRVARASLMTAADRQIAEIERTFTLRYEW
jgi:hypothetical protein